MDNTLPILKKFKVSKYFYNVIYFFNSLLIGLVLTLILYNIRVLQNKELFYNISEYCFIFMYIITFVVVWYTYKLNPLSNLITSFGLLFISIYYLYIVFYISYFNQDINKFALYWSIGKFIKSIVILLVTSTITNKKINKWIFLYVILFFGTSISHLLMLSCAYLYTNYGLLLINEITRYLLYISLLVYLLSLYRLIKNRHYFYKINFKYFINSIALIILAYICIIFKSNNFNLIDVFVNIIELIAYHNIFNGIFMTAVRYPYEKLETSKKNLTEILNALPIGLCTFDINSNLLYMNSKGENILGIKKNELIGYNINDILKTFCFNMENYSSIIYRLDKSTSKHSSGPILCKNNYGYMITLNVTIHKLFNNGMIFLFNEAKKEQDLHNIQIQTQTILNSIANFVIMLNKDSKIIMCNKHFEDLIEAENSQFIGNNFLSLARELGISNQLVVSIFSSEVFNKDICINTLYGNKRFVLFNSSPIYNVNQEKIGTIIVGSDITEMKNEQEKLIQKEKLAILGQVCASIIHEIKNYLATAKGTCQILNLSVKDENISKYTHKIESSIDDINKIVSDFLMMAKPREAELKEVSLNAIVQYVKGLLDASTFSNNVKINVLLTSKEKLIYCDEHQIKQIILNMCKNAIEAMSNCQRPTLTVSTSYDSSINQMLLIINDNGMGIPEGIKEKIGTPFFTTKVGGTGLGLNTCYKIIKDHNGSIDLESQSGKGTTFTIKLPCYASEEQQNLA